MSTSSVTCPFFNCHFQEKTFANQFNVQATIIKHSNAKSKDRRLACFYFAFLSSSFIIEFINDHPSHTSSLACLSLVAFSILLLFLLFFHSSTFTCLYTNKLLRLPSRYHVFFVFITQTNRSCPPCIVGH